MESKSTSRVRLNKALSDAGVTSRRQADKLIAEGSITVNGKRVYELGVKVDPRKDKILVSGKPLKAKSAAVYAIFHKPKGILTTMEDPEGRPTIAPFLEDLPVRLFPVGRLDWDSEGLLLLTNDGDWAQKVMRPQSQITKTYLVKVKGEARPDALQRLRTGVSIIGGKVSAKFVEKIERGKDKYPWYKIVITEGKNRQIRLMFEKVGLDVMKLQRIGIGRLRLGSIERGRLVFLNDEMASQVFLPDMSGAEEDGRKERQVSTKKVVADTDASILDSDLLQAKPGAKKVVQPLNAKAAAIAARKNQKSKKSRVGQKFKGKPLADKKVGAKQSQRKNNRDAAVARKGTKANPKVKAIDFDNL